MRDLLAPEIGGLANAIKFVSLTDVFMLSHMTSVNYTANALMFEGALRTTSGLFLFLLIPGIIFFTIGFFMNRHVQSGIEARLIRNVSLSVIYAVIVGIISLFAGISLSIPDPTGIMGDITLSANYSFVESMFNAFVNGRKEVVLLLKWEGGLS
ncbi:hypothetical protein JCM9140_1370 [Halalkalibacter wakoensis JCM 9140]|uniref:Uncharacterized protein n=1 Tax=Halalkalibacter wakoensis JCM 9140 TaxID=1236970 RepID=W4Q1X7_9BACI|nr:hypothetical protein [Halalkalibacter wakoensis]GAE25379.1 hypothetical protein JCM9140_1370 [Halalkalibacter wakoensis JCM 9140]